MLAGSRGQKSDPIQKSGVCVIEFDTQPIQNPARQLEFGLSQSILQQRSMFEFADKTNLRVPLNTSGISDFRRSRQFCRTSTYWLSQSR